MPKPLAALAVLVAAVSVIYAADLGHAPIYLHDAEVLFALQAHSIATTLHDTNGRLLPLYFQMPQIGENVWFHPMMVYALAPVLEVLPLSETAIRLPSVMVGLTNVILIYFIGARIFRSERWGLLAAGLLALTPSHFMHSRIAMDYILPVPFVLAWLLCLLAFLDDRRPWTLVAATSCLGLGVYSYIASIIMMPFYLGVTLVAIRTTTIRPIRSWLIALAGFVWPLCLLAWFLFHPDVIVQTLTRYGLDRGVVAPWPKGAPLGVVLETMWRTARLSGRVSQYWSFFDPAYLFLTGGYANVVNSTRHAGVFPMPFIVFVPVGLVALARRQRPVVDALILTAFASAPLAACLVVPEPYAIDRELELLPFGALIATAGARHLLTAPERAWRTAGVALLAAVPLYFAFFSVDYYRDYPRSAAFWFDFNRRGAIEELLTRERTLRPPAIYVSIHHISYIDAYWRLYLIKHGRQDLLARTVYFDSERDHVETIPAGSLFLAARDDTPLLAPSIDAGLLRRLAAIPEPADPPYFSILVRAPNGVQ